MKNLTLLILLSQAFTARAQTVKKDSDYSKELYKESCKCYLAKDPKSAPIWRKYVGQASAVATCV